MADSDDVQESVERQMAIERARLGIETHLAHLDRWRTTIDPLNRSSELSRGFAFGYAKIGIQSLFALNGGALIAFPPFAQLVGTNFALHIEYVLIALSSFVVGLVLVGVTTLVAAIALEHDAASINAQAEVTKLDLVTQMSPSSQASSTSTDKAKLMSTQQEEYKASRRMRWFGIVLAVFSMIAFVVGSFFSAVVLAAAK